jgi:hypothetical protein
VVSSAQPSNGALAARLLVMGPYKRNWTFMLTIRAMEMDRVRTIGMVDEAYNCLGSLAHHESGAWCDTVIANESGLSKIGVDCPGC